MARVPAGERSDSHCFADDFDAGIAHLQLFS